MKNVSIIILYLSLILNCLFTLTVKTSDATATPVATASPTVVAAEATATPVATASPTAVVTAHKQDAEHRDVSSSLSSYEFQSLVATWSYNVFTFLLLCFVVYESIIKPRIPNLECNIIRLRSRGVRPSGHTFPHCDLFIKNHGRDLRNIQISSKPDELNWDHYDEDTGKERKDAKTSEHFPTKIPCLASNQTLQIYWCDMSENKEVFQEPFVIYIEFDNPLPIISILKRRSKESFYFDYSAYKGIISGIAKKYDIHDVAEEIYKMRDSMKDFKRELVRIIHNHESRLSEQEDKKSEPPSSR